MEAWLKANRRALLLGMLLPIALLAAGVAGIGWGIAFGYFWAMGLFGLPVVAAIWLLTNLVSIMGRPRIAYESGQLLVYLDFLRPTRVPIDIVECFFLGQGPSSLPKLNGREPETQNVVIRLAESATDWKHRDVRPVLGHWCEGYITIRGSWCEPITPALMRRLNQRLAEAHREQQAAKLRGDR